MLGYFVLIILIGFYLTNIHIVFKNHISSGKFFTSKIDAIFMLLFPLVILHFYLKIRGGF